MTRQQFIPIILLVGFGIAATAAFTGLIDIEMIYVYVAGATLLVGLGAGQVWKKSDTVTLVVTLVGVGILAVLSFTSNLPFFQGLTTPQHTYVGVSAFFLGMGSGKAL